MFSVDEFFNTIGQEQTFDAAALASPFIRVDWVEVEGHFSARVNVCLRYDRDPSEANDMT